MLAVESNLTGETALSLKSAQRYFDLAIVEDAEKDAKMRELVERNS